MTDLVGEPSDRLPNVLANGDGGANVAFVSLSAGDPDGRDGEYLEWHTYDHRPEQHRIAELRASMRLRATARCRAARVAAAEGFDRVEHVMNYFFSSAAGLGPFDELGRALWEAGRMPFLLPAVDRRVFGLTASTAAARIKAGAQVLPWWPVEGIFLLIERGAEPVGDLTEIAGVAGTWSGHSTPDLVPDWMQTGSEHDASMLITYCFLDDDPVDVTVRLRKTLDHRWSSGDTEPLLAAPFKTVVSRRDWEPWDD